MRFRVLCFGVGCRCCEGSWYTAASMARKAVIAAAEEGAGGRGEVIEWLTIGDGGRGGDGV